MPQPDRRIHAHRAGDRRVSLNIRDFGDEVHLWFEQRVSWPVALEILKELTHDAASRPRDDAAQQWPPFVCLRRSRRPHARGDSSRPLSSGWMSSTGHARMRRALSSTAWTPLHTADLHGGGDGPGVFSARGHTGSSRLKEP